MFFGSAFLLLIGTPANRKKRVSLCAVFGPVSASELVVVCERTSFVTTRQTVVVAARN